MSNECANITEGVEDREWELLDNRF